MSEEKSELSYWDSMDQFIQLANQQCELADADDVSEALLNASARFCAFLVAVNTEDKKAFQEEQEESARFLTMQFKRMLNEHLNDYEENYKEYMKERD